MLILEILLMGTILGWGAAIPIGPINLEIIRRNLQFDTHAGLVFGFGACSADLLYLILLSYGALSLLTYPLVLKIVGLVGAIILAYFGYCALTLKNTDNKIDTHTPRLPRQQYLSGLLLTLSNPMTILFWASISAQVVNLTKSHPYATIYAGIGVIIGTFSWVVLLNVFIHFTKHKISDRAINILNKIGGIILLGFAGLGIYRFI
jgi:L-lysine exporter family protein LysE/ArgO